MREKLRVGFIGAGTVGAALAQCLADAGYRVAAVSSRSQTSAARLAAQLPAAQVFSDVQGVVDTADLVFITTPDSAIQRVADDVRWHQGQMVAHCSGAESTDVLEPARVRGAHVGVMHPLQSFTSPAQALENLPGSTFALEGESPIIEALESMAKALGGHCLYLTREQKALYHAAAVIASNYLVTLADMAACLWQEFGVESKDAVAALLPLMRGTLSNLERVGIPDCLTGPIARGDSSTVRKHLEALTLRAPALLTVYRELASQTIPIAAAKGTLTPERAEELRRLLAEEKVAVY